MDVRHDARIDAREEGRLTDRLIPSPRDAWRAIQAASRCWLLHRWSPWTLYETVRPVRAIGPSLRHVGEVAEMRRRRHCVRCGKRDDRYVGQKVVPADQRQPSATRGFASVAAEQSHASRAASRAE
jgi:hypothetical protein